VAPSYDESLMKEPLRPNLLSCPSSTLFYVHSGITLCNDVITALIWLLPLAMANATVNQLARLLYSGDLFSASELLSQKTALAIVAVLSISLLWHGFQRRRFYRGLVSNQPPHPAN
jgi:hypothetical protein